MSLRGIIFLSMYCLGVSAQQEFPFSQYLPLREKLRTRYLIPGDCHGCSLPASWYDSTKSHLVYEDETTRQLGWYLALLATEYYLFQKEKILSTETEQELYYALKAINRLDGLAEYLRCTSVSAIQWDNENKIFRRNASPPCWSDTLKNNRNGFLIREDIPPGWHLNFAGDQPVRHGDGNGNWIVSDQIKKHPHPASQDQLYHLMFGLAFVCKFIPEDLTVNGLIIKAEARNIASRFMQVFDVDFRIRNPVSGEALDADVGGNGKIFSFFLAVAADLLVNQRKYPAAENQQKKQDEQNPWFNNTARNHKSLWNNFTGSLWTGVSFASPNQIMTILLLGISNALNGYPENTTATLLSKTSSFYNPEYKFFQNVFNVLHESKVPFGYKKKEMEDMLLAMDNLGPRRYSNPQTCEVIQNKIWNRDCIFVQPRIAPCTDRSFEGHFNGIDYLLFHNLYFIQYGLNVNPEYPVWVDTIGVQIQVMPNPADEELIVSYQALLDKRIEITIHDATGRMVYTLNNVLLLAGKGEFLLDLKNYTAGLYYLSIRSSAYKKSIRLIIS
jgi:hypothetical protein